MKIVILTSFEQAARAVICEAYKKVSDVRPNQGRDCCSEDELREEGLNGRVWSKRWFKVEQGSEGKVKGKKLTYLRNEVTDVG